MVSGIVAYGAYVPKLRIKAEEIEKQWNKENTAQMLNVVEKSVADYDEDTCTLSIEASTKALQDFSINPKNIGAVYIGSESHPYAVKSTSAIVASLSSSFVVNVLNRRSL